MKVQLPKGGKETDGSQYWNRVCRADSMFKPGYQSRYEY